MKYTVEIDIEECIFKPFREAVRDSRICRKKYGAFSSITVFAQGQVQAYSDLCKKFGLLERYNRWAYTHREEEKEDAQT